MNSDLFEQDIIGKNATEITNLIGLSPEIACPEEHIYIIKSYFFGLVKKRLYIYFHKGLARDFFID